MSEVETYKVWPSDWRVVHFMQTNPDNVPLVLAPIMDNPDFPYEVFTDGDCGIVWGEPREEKCIWHVQVYCPGDQVYKVLECLRNDRPNEVTGRKTTRYYVYVTDPNDWGEKVNNIKWTKENCRSGIH